jgi:hypothetical protein
VIKLCTITPHPKKLCVNATILQKPSNNDQLLHDLQNQGLFKWRQWISEILNHVDIFPRGQLIPTHCTTYWVTLPHANYKIIIFLEQKQASWTSYDKEPPIQIPHHWQPPYHWQPPHDWVKFPLGTNKIPFKFSPNCVLLLSGIVITRNKHSKYTRVIAIAFSLFLVLKIKLCLKLKYL